jgi:hypothetical protein
MALCLLFIIPSSVYAVDLNEIKIKVVVVFEYPNNINKLKSDYNKDLAPILEASVNNFGIDNNFTNYSWRTHDINQTVEQVGFNQTSGNNIYSIYPKVLFEGVNSQTEEEFNTEFDILVGQTRQTIVNFLQVNGASNAWTHIHFSWGGADLVETF